MRMQKKQFRIGELAKKIGVERFVIRFWEKEFNVSGSRSQGGQRFYEEKDLAYFQKIKELLYGQGYTIVGAKKYFKHIKQVPFSESIIGSTKTTHFSQEESLNAKKTSVPEKQENTLTCTHHKDALSLLQKKLVLLRKNLH